MSADNPDAGDDTPETGRRVERSFACTHCGYAMVHEVTLLRAEVGAVCHNCGDWTVQTADEETVLEAAREAAGTLAGEVLTERQALAYLLREVLGIGRQRAAEVLESTPSNVDNLHRRGQEKVTAARRLVDGLDALRTGEGDAAGQG